MAQRCRGRPELSRPTTDLSRGEGHPTPVRRAWPRRSSSWSSQDPRARRHGRPDRPAGPLPGRPAPYGYRLIDAGPHPNPAKARLGVRLHALEPDPATAPVVVRIFQLFLDGHGYLAIAERLTAEQIPPPSGHDRARNPHRLGVAWGKSAVRAILQNPRYTGSQVWNKQRRDEVLLDVDDVAAGHISRMRWNPRDQWVYSAEPTHPPLVSRETFDRVQARIAARSRTSPAPPRPPGARMRCGGG
jgi:site-specific DNA recombinase